MAEVAVIDATLHNDRNFHNDLIHALAEFGYKAAVMPYQEAPERLEQIKAAHGVIVPGVPFTYPSQSAEELRPYLQSWLPELSIPVLGICLGHQAMGLVFGATMQRNVEVEEGICPVEIAEGHRTDPIFKDLGEHFEVVNHHWASISIATAPRLIRLARSLPKLGISTGCENQVVRVADRPYYGTQFHPEKSAVGKILLRNFLALPARRISR
jgi:GMP synthase-like glutamine amidotransferase